MFSLQPKKVIGAYTVIFPIKKGNYAETYRVKDSSGRIFFLKLFNYAKLHRTQFDKNNEVL
jgi:transitional endoplasmic reticulum ATPase